MPGKPALPVTPSRRPWRISSRSAPAPTARATTTAPTSLARRRRITSARAASGATPSGAARARRSISASAPASNSAPSEAGPRPASAPSAATGQPQPGWATCSGRKVLLDIGLERRLHAARPLARVEPIRDLAEGRARGHSAFSASFESRNMLVERSHASGPPPPSRRRCSRPRGRARRISFAAVRDDPSPAFGRRFPTCPHGRASVDLPIPDRSIIDDI